jgi:hypothetical protein
VRSKQGSVSASAAVKGMAGTAVNSGEKSSHEPSEHIPAS